MLVSCASSDDDCNCFNYSVEFDVKIKSLEGFDLLNPDTPNTLNTDNIKLFYLKNGVVEEVYNSNLDYPRNYMIFEDTEGVYTIRIFPNHIQSEEYPITYIQWNETDTDTIKCQFVYTEHSIAVTKVWFNGELKIDVEEGTEFLFEITK